MTSFSATHFASDARQVSPSWLSRMVSLWTSRGRLYLWLQKRHGTAIQLVASRRSSLAHRVRKPDAVKIALENLQRAAGTMPTQVASCGPFVPAKSITNVCGADWRWCSTPFSEQVQPPAPRTVRRRPSPKA